MSVQYSLFFVFSLTMFVSGGLQNVLSAMTLNLNESSPIPPDSKYWVTISSHVPPDSKYWVTISSHYYLLLWVRATKDLVFLNYKLYMRPLHMSMISTNIIYQSFISWSVMTAVPSCQCTLYNCSKRYIIVIIYCYPVQPVLII